MHCSSHSSHTKLVGFWYSPLHEVYMCEEGWEEGRSNGGRKEGQEKRCPRCTRWACSLATHTLHCSSVFTPNPNLDPSGRDTTEQFCTQRLRYRKFRQPSHCASSAPQQLKVESHCSWHMNELSTKWEGNIHSVTTNKK